MGILISSDFIVFIVIVALALIYLAYAVTRDFIVKIYKGKIKGLTKYKSEVVMSVGGFKCTYGWFANDDCAIKILKGDFITAIYPSRRKVK